MFTPASHADGPVTEVLAAERVAPFAHELRKQVAQNFIDAGRAGLSPDQVCQLHPTVHDYTVRPRITELKKLDLLAATEERRKNRRKNSEEVLRWIGPATVAEVEGLD